MDYKVAHFTGLKSLGDTGEFVATIATLNVIDLDGDVTLPGAFPDGKQVQLAAWGHDWGALPYGIATLHEVGNEQQAHGQFNLNTSHGRDAYETVKMSQAIQEWSYGFQVEDAAPGQMNGQDVRFLKRLDVAEISPVMRGAAGPGMTRVEMIKAAPFTFDEQTDAALAAVQAYIDRAKSLAGLRAKDGRPLSAANLGRVERVHSALSEALPELQALLALARAESGEGEAADDSGKSKNVVAGVLAQYEYTASRLHRLGIMPVGA